MVTGREVQGYGSWGAWVHRYWLLPQVTAEVRGSAARDRGAGVGVLGLSKLVVVMWL